MVMAEAVIHFRFKNETTLDKFTFSGSSVSVKELKNHISTKHKLDQVSSRPDKRQAPSELSLQNDATGEGKSRYISLSCHTSAVNPCPCSLCQRRYGDPERYHGAGCAKASWRREW